MNQKKLIDAFNLLSTADNTQVILTTHSATIVKQLSFSNLRMISCEADGSRRIVEAAIGILQYPSLNEVNYVAFGEVTEEYHDELYAFLEYNQLVNDYKIGKPSLPYVRLKNDGSTQEEQHILAIYIRHQIHHPENHLNTHYTIDQLKQSIEDMRNYIYDRAEQEICRSTHYISNGMFS